MAGGGLLLLATVDALLWANSPWSGAYKALGDLTVGPAVLHLDLTLGAWAADGLLAVFLFVGGSQSQLVLVVPKMLGAEVVDVAKGHRPGKVGVPGGGE